MTQTSLRHQHGLSLVELMVAMALSLLLMLGVIQIFLSSKQTYSTNVALSRVQESGRFALEFMANDIRNAGYKGDCLGPPNNLLDEASPAYSSELFDLNVAIMGWDENVTPAPAAKITGIANRTPGTDMILVKHAAQASGATATGATPANSNTISVNNASSIPNNSIVIVADALGCDVFQTSNNKNANSLTRQNQGTPGNKNPGHYNFSHAYGNSMEILSLQSALYYIGTGANNRPSLRRVTFNSGIPVNMELVEGIENIQITYGLTDAKRQVTEYKVAKDMNLSEWSDVGSVRIQALAVGADQNVVSATQTLLFNGTNVNISQRRLGQVFTSTLGVRNRLQ
ncbi:PilW family protein [Stutzerimonas stutzeri]|uniref:PilW family protein n=1 Tax=Stutzerimonas stutzeri TaxID=316 RepID=UPI000308E965|nr:PilW family protein [Stutzerimonas stutzeri]